MQRMRRRATAPSPVQARPVGRDDRPVGTARVAADGGVIAARSTCAGLTGLAKQMCYASQYGISV